MSQPKKIGVSGGIGSGKTFVCKLIEKRGYPVYYSDAAAKRLMNENAIIRQELIALCGPEAYQGSQLNRPFLASIIFNDEEKRNQVNRIVHPKVHADFNAWASNQHAEIVFYESALLFQSNAYKLLDATILVVSPLELRIERTMKRDNASREQIEARISSQGNQEDYRNLATFIIENTSGSEIEPQLEHLLNQL